MYFSKTRLLKYIKIVHTNDTTKLYILLSYNKLTIILSSSNYAHHVNWQQGTKI